jgi:RNA polymerase sigma factor (TIGR02999 family)
MPDVTQLLDAAAAGNSRAATDLLPLVYDELRRLAADHLARERSGHTLQATALVHEAFLRLVASPLRERGGQHWSGRGHFFGAAARAMWQILVDAARRKAAD